MKKMVVIFVSADQLFSSYDLEWIFWINSVTNIIIDDIDIKKFKKYRDEYEYYVAPLDFGMTAIAMDFKEFDKLLKTFQKNKSIETIENLIKQSQDKQIKEYFCELVV